MPGKKVIFLDRDGTINVDHGYVYELEKWVFIERAIEALKMLQDGAYKLVVVTNQSGVAHELYREEDMHRLHDLMKKQLGEHGIVIDAIAFCLHGRDSTCECRKPKAGMVKQVEKQIGEIDYNESWTVGDKPLDVGFGKNTGTRTALLRSKYWDEDDLKEKPDIIVDSLYEAAKVIVNENQESRIMNNKL